MFAHVAMIIIILITVRIATLFVYLQYPGATSNVVNGQMSVNSIRQI